MCEREGRSLVTLFEGNCYSLLGDVLKDIEDPVIVTDPPFNIGYHYKSYKDRKNEDIFYATLANIVLSAPSVIIMYPEMLHRLSIALSEPPVDVLTWCYNANTAKQHRDIAYYRIKPDLERVRQPYKDMKDKRCIALYKKTGGARMYDWFECPQVKNKSKDKTAHPCQMPLEVMDKIVGVLPDGVTVIDPFAGSGTTLLACAKRNIPCVGIELDHEYCNIIKDRLENEGFNCEVKVHEEVI